MVGTRGSSLLRASNSLLKTSSSAERLGKEVQEVQGEKIGNCPLGEEENEGHRCNSRLH